MAISGFVCTVMSSGVLVFFPGRQREFIKFVQFIVVCVLGIICLFGLNIDKVYIVGLASLKLFALNAYEFAQWCLEDEQEREIEHTRRMELYKNSWLLDVIFLILLFI